MQTLLRLAFLGVFAAAGVALAVSVAVHNEPHEFARNEGPNPFSATSQREPLDKTAGEKTSAEPHRGPAAAEAAPANLVSASPLSQAGNAPWAPSVVNPWLAPYHPSVGSQFDEIRRAIDSVQSTQRRTEDVVLRLQEELPKPSPRPTEPASSPVAGTQAEKEPKIHVGEGDQSITIDVQNSDIREVLKLLSEAGGLNILATPNVTGRVSASLSGIDMETGLKAVLKSGGFVSQREGTVVYVGTPRDLEGMRHASEVLRTRIYRPNYVTAQELQKLITPMVSNGAGAVAVSTASEIGIQSDAANVGGDSFAGGEVVLVRDYASVLDQIDKMVAEVDKMPRQVAIEATILSVKLGDKNKLGVDFELLRQKDTIRIVSGTPLESIVNADFADGLKIGFLDTSLFLFLEALETIGDTNVIASPRVMCLNKQRAEILIGRQDGYVSTTVTETAATQAVEFLESGTHLRIRPFISSDGMVRMEVHPELSNGGVEVVGEFTLPNKEVTQVTTNIMCRSGSTVVIGGLIREELVTQAVQIPLLGNLPLVGPLFRRRTEEIDRHEIIVLITPRVVHEPELHEEGAHYANQFHDRRSVFVDKMSPIGKRYYGERYTRLATAAWAAADAETALRYVNLAIHFDPLNERAVSLRGEILAASPALETGVDQHLRPGLAPWQHPHRDYSRAGWPWQMPQWDPTGISQFIDTYDSGQPGEVRDLDPDPAK